VRPRRVARIARWEAGRNVGSVDRRTLVVGAVGVALVLALIPAVTGGVALDRGIYRIGVADDNPLAGPAAADATFAVREPSREAFAAGRIEILVLDDRATYRDTEKGQAAVAEFRRAVERYNDRRMREEPNESAAFPVFPVTVRYVDRGGREAIAPGGTRGGDDGAGGGDGAAGEESAGGDSADRATEDGGGGLGGGVGPNLFAPSTDAGLPSEIAPPFPFGSLVLAFAFVVPLNFVVQAYGSSVLSERINRRGELLLVAPVTRGEIIAGKTAPYLLASLSAATVVALAVGGGPLSVAAIAPLALLFLAATFVGAMFARSFKELTFVTVAVSVFLTAYAFVPAVFTEASAVALVSPLTLVVRDLSGTPVTAGEAAFATLPATLTALVLFLFGAGVYREEDMFTQRSVHLKALDALAGRIARARSLVVVVALLMPFVFVAELLAVALLFALPGGLSIPLLFVLIAVIEELAKAAPVLAGYTHARYQRTASSALVVGGFAGLGFFLGEKLTLLVQLVGLPELAAGSAAFGTAAGVATGDPLVIVALLVAPLALHVVTAVTSSLGAASGGRWFPASVVAAVVVHLAYNLTVVSSLVG